MNWFTLSMVCAISLALSDAYTKKYYAGYSGVYILLVRLGLPGMVLLPFSIYFGLFDLPLAFWYYMSVLAPLEILAMWLYVLAIRDAPLHLTLPYLAFTPVFNILTGYLVLDEVISLEGGLGILCIVIGTYLLNLDHVKKSGMNYLAPFRAIVTLRGSRLMLLASIIYSLTSVYSKQAIQYSTPLAFGAFYFTIIGCLLVVMVLLTQPATVTHIARRPRPSLVVGGLMAIMVVTHFMAIAQVEVAYMIAVKRTSLIFGMLLGAWMFRDMNFRQHLPAGILMVAGVFLILLY
ncbi:MAG: DMT family transporter [Gammaproteobacteria bacterium]|nr:DMT family transporter [Gammaproteobacteria bacterium]